MILRRADRLLAGQQMRVVMPDYVVYRTLAAVSIDEDLVFIRFEPREGSADPKEPEGFILNVDDYVQVMA